MEDVLKVVDSELGYSGLHSQVKSNSKVGVVSSTIHLLLICYTFFSRSCLFQTVKKSLGMSWLRAYHRYLLYLAVYF